MARTAFLQVNGFSIGMDGRAYATAAYVVVNDDGSAGPSGTVNSLNPINFDDNPGMLLNQLTGGVQVALSDLDLAVTFVTGSP